MNPGVLRFEIVERFDEASQFDFRPGDRGTVMAPPCETLEPPPGTVYELDVEDVYFANRCYTLACPTDFPTPALGRHSRLASPINGYPEACRNGDWTVDLGDGCIARRVVQVYEIGGFGTPLIPGARPPSVFAQSMVRIEGECAHVPGFTTGSERSCTDLWVVDVDLPE